MLSDSKDKNQIPQTDEDRGLIARHCSLAFTGFFIGLCASSMIALMRMAVSALFDSILSWNAPGHRTFSGILLWIIFALAAALITGWLARNPAIRFGGERWILDAIKNGQPHIIGKILLPKFISTWLVLGTGVSVGSEGPSIQIGAATAISLRSLGLKSTLDRRFFILAGCAAGLGGAFTAPFSGIAYVYEVMREKFNSELFEFLLASSIGVYVGCTQIFGLGVLLPVSVSFMPNFWQTLALLPLAFFAAGVGIAYNFLLRLSKRLYAAQKAVPAFFQPLFSFGITIIIVLAIPALAGGGLSIFTPIETGHTTFIFLCIFLAAKLLLTAFCYGSAIPAGVMVPILCLGGVAGSIYADCLVHLYPAVALAPVCIVIGMGAAFAAAERAPVTAMILVAEMTGAWAASLVLLLTSAIAGVLARLAHVQDI